MGSERNAVSASLDWYKWGISLCVGQGGEFLKGRRKGDPEGDVDRVVNAINNREEDERHLTRGIYPAGKRKILEERSKRPERITYIAKQVNKVAKRLIKKDKMCGLTTPDAQQFVNFGLNAPVSRQIGTARLLEKREEHRKQNAKLANHGSLKTEI